MNTKPTAPQPSINLWNLQVTPEQYGRKPELYYEHAFEQYKLYVASSEQVSTRRASMNTLFVTVQTLLVTAIGIIVSAGYRLEPRWFVLFPLVGVLLLCWFWLQLIRSYRSLNTGKFKVIEEYEKRLPTGPFVQAEWYGALRMNTRKGLYMRFTDVEQSVPVAFMFLYTFSATAFIFLQ